jgi:predicted nuclease with TOPRIM domain
MSSNFDLEHWQEVCYAHEAELQWLRAENAQLRKELTEAQKERAHQQGRATRNAKEYAAEQERTNRLRAENARLREVAAELGRIDYPDVTYPQSSIEKFLKENDEP